MNGTENAAGQLAAVLRSRVFALTAEIVPPVSCERRDLLEKALPLRGLADAVNIPDSPSARVHLGALAAAVILLENGIEPVVQMTCRDRNRIALQSDLLAAATLGVRNLLLLRGDDPAGGDDPEAKAVFDLDSGALLAIARNIRDHGTLASGKHVAGEARFLLGAADTPIDPPPGWRPAGLKAKVAAGAQFVQTQFCMDAGIVRRYIGRLAEAGMVPQLHVLIGVVPLRSGRSARWMRRHLPGTLIPETLIARLDGAADPETEGGRACVELISELAEIPGVAGAHVMAPGNERAIPEVLAAARARLQSREGGPVVAVER